MISTHSHDTNAIFTYASGGYDRLLGVNSKVSGLDAGTGGVTGGLTMPRGLSDCVGVGGSSADGLLAPVLGLVLMLVD